MTSYENHDDLHDKIKREVPPTSRDKEWLMNRINRQLSEEEHMVIFTDFLGSDTMKKRIYSINDNGTLFDLNDVPPAIFWKICLFTVMSLKDREKAKVSDQATQEVQDELARYRSQVNAELPIAQQNQPKLSSDLENLTPYEKMRIQALGQCSYSTYSKSSMTTLNSDDKRIYSDRPMKSI
jgi:hypothetical protein